MPKNKLGSKKRKRPSNNNNKNNNCEPQDDGVLSDDTTISDYYDDDYEDIIPNHVNKKQKVSHAPPANNILDLINIGKSNFLYNNIDNNMLSNIVPYLEELNNMIGLESLKNSIFYQIIYYLQNMHLRNKNEEYLHTVITGPAGCGKCLAKNTPIIMYDGSVKMVQDIKVGDKLMGDDSKIRNVTSLARGQEKMYKIKQLKGDDYIVNESHILSLKLTRIDENTYDIVDIPVLDYLKLSNDDKLRLKGFKVGVEFEKKEIPFDPYILGFWLGDDSFNNTGITDQDSLYLEYKETSLLEVLNRFDLIDNKHIPDIYKINNKEIRLKLLAGLLDCGGKLSGNYYEISKNNKKIIDDIAFLARSLGFYVNISENYDKIKYLYYTLFIHGNLEEIPVLIKRNKISNLTYNKDVLQTEITIEELETDDYYGFTIDGNHRFLLGDFTVTHNTTVAKIMGNIYKSMGILSRKGKFTTAYRQDFVGEYVGHTAPKTQNLLESCLGGVLFIDEVYALGSGEKNKDSFSKEAIDTLNAFLSDHKNDFCCIIAGYENEIKKCFFSVNSGLERRFPWIHRIGEYSSENLVDIAFKMILQTKWEFNIDRPAFIKLFDTNKDLFKNSGGDIETFITKCKMVHSKRVFSLDNELKFILTEEDLTNAIKMLKDNRLEIKKKEEDNISRQMMYI